MSDRAFWVEQCGDALPRPSTDNRNFAPITVTVAEDIQYRCVKCAFGPETLEQLRRHITVDHLKWIPYECLYCDLFKATDEELTEHMHDSHPYKPVKLVVEKNEPMRLQLEHLIHQSTFTQPTIQRHPHTITVNLATAERESSWAEEEARSLGARTSVSVASAAAPLPSPSPVVRAPNPLPWTFVQPKPEIVHIDDEADALARVETEAQFQWCSDALKTTIKEDLPSNDQLITDNAAAAAVSAVESVARPPSPPPSLPRKRGTTIHHLKLKSKRCSECGLDMRKASVGPSQHVHECHLFEPAVVCKYCSAGVPYHIGRLRHHIAMAHPGADIESGIDDRRDELWPTVETLLLRCFGEKKTHQHKIAAKTYCFVCEMDFDDNAKTMRKHVLFKHTAADKTTCMYCAGQWPHKKKSMLTHLRNVHPMESEELGWQHSLEQFKQKHKYWMKRCLNPPGSESADSEVSPCESDKAEPIQTAEETATLSTKAIVDEIKVENEDTTEIQESEPTCAHIEIKKTTDNTSIGAQGIKLETAASEEIVSVLDDSNEICELSTASSKTAKTSNHNRSIKKSSKSVRKYCELCKKVVWFGRRHIRLRHLPPGVWVFACSACDFGSNANAAAVRRHVDEDGCGGALDDRSAQHAHEIGRLYAACFANAHRRRPSAAAANSVCHGDTICID